MEQSHSNPMTDDPESPVGFGCSACLRIFSTDTFFLHEVSGYNYCVGCGAPGIKFLGVLPMTMEEDGKFYLIGDEDGLVTGPYDTQQAAQSNVWSWFARKDSHGEVTTKGRQKGHLRLAALEGVTLEEDVQEGAKEEGST